jgi:putative SOS response-associated peptidase YedK
MGYVLTKFRDLIYQQDILIYSIICSTTFSSLTAILGLVPFWTKRNPDYNNVLKTINARDDSLADNRGMWTTMKQRKRCIIIAQGFYEWLKKNNGKEKIPHYVKRKDNQLMCFAGLWDCVQYEGEPEFLLSQIYSLYSVGVEEKNYTYTIITTDSNKQLKFLHDRMPVILENGTDQIRTWLDPQRHEWTKELQSLLKPYDGELECYPVTKDVGKVGNNSPTFIVPVSSSENKNNIANFFVHGKSASQMGSVGQNKADIPGCDDGSKVKAEPEVKYEDERKTVNKPRSEDNAPVPVPRSEDNPKPLKREREDHEEVGNVDAKRVKTEEAVSRQVTKPSEETRGITTPRKGRSATSNGTKPKSSPAKANDGSQKITNFFVK